MDTHPWFRNAYENDVHTNIPRCGLAQASDSFQTAPWTMPGCILTEDALIDSVTPWKPKARTKDPTKGLWLQMMPWLQCVALFVSSSMSLDRLLRFFFVAFAKPRTMTLLLVRTAFDTDRSVFWDRIYISQR